MENKTIKDKKKKVTFNKQITVLKKNVKSNLKKEETVKQNKKKEEATALVSTELESSKNDAKTPNTELISQSQMDSETTAAISENEKKLKREKKLKKIAKRKKKKEKLKADLKAKRAAKKSKSNSTSRLTMHTGIEQVNDINEEEFNSSK